MYRKKLKDLCFAKHRNKTVNELNKLLTNLICECDYYIATFGGEAYNIFLDKVRKIKKSKKEIDSI